jgi:hypothetical protein
MPKPPLSSGNPELKARFTIEARTHAAEIHQRKCATTPSAISCVIPVSVEVRNKFGTWWGSMVTSRQGAMPSAPRQVSGHAPRPTAIQFCFMKYRHM